MNSCLGLDTSCYCTSAALSWFDGKKWRYEQQRKLLSVPPGARGLQQSEMVFQHVKQLPELVESLLQRHSERIGCVCASVRPRPAPESYMPVFRVGEGFARTMATALRAPFFETSHQQGHLRAAMIETPLTFSGDFLAVHLSGGTTELLFTRNGDIEPLGGTKDLHAGQLIDRVGVRLGLPFPAGPTLEKMAAQGRALSRLTASVLGGDCHFSGAEAQAFRLLDAGESPEDVAAEVFSCVSRTVARLILAGFEKTGAETALIGGGVSSSGLIRSEILSRVEKRNRRIRIFFGKPELSGDNAVGVACIGAERARGEGQ